MLTAIQRPVLPTAPAFGFNAHVAGSGKSYLAKTISWLSGNEPSEMPWSIEAEEQRKRLTAALLNGQSSILIDNINGILDSDTLCSILTGESYSDRKLGVSENLQLSTRALFLVTGNNVTVIKDLTRRIIVVTIDHKVERPSKIAFPFNPVVRMRDNWLKYRIAGLTILSAYIAAGSPRIVGDTVGSFEYWDSMIRQCVCWLGQQRIMDVGDPIKLIDNTYEADPELDRLKQFHSQWYEAYQSNTKTVAEVISDSKYKFGASYIQESLLRDVSGGKDPNSRVIAAFLRRHKNRIVNGYSITDGSLRNGIGTWIVKKH